MSTLRDSLPTYTAHEWADWLYECKMPFNGHLDVQPPPEVVRLLAERWAREDDEPVENYIWAIKEESGWDAA